MGLTEKTQDDLLLSAWLVTLVHLPETNRCNVTMRPACPGATVAVRVAVRPSFMLAELSFAVFSAFTTTAWLGDWEPCWEAEAGNRIAYEVLRSGLGLKDTLPPELVLAVCTTFQVLEPAVWANRSTETALSP